MGPEVYDQIVASLYAAAVGAGPWSAALDALAAAMDLWWVQVAVLQKHSSRLVCNQAGGLAPAPIRVDYARRHQAMNPGISDCMALRVGEWRHSAQTVDEDYVARSAFFRDFLVPRGGRHISTVKVLDDARVLALLTLVRGVAKPPLESAELGELDRILMHLRHAIATSIDLKRSASELEAPKRLLDQFSYAMFLIDEQRAIRARNSAADAALNAAEGFLEERSGALACRDPECDASLAQALRSLHLSSVHGAALPSRRFARLKNPDGCPIGLYAVAIRPDAAMGMFGPAPLALLIFHDPRQQFALDPFIVAEMFELSPAEAKVAVLLALGKAPDEIASAGGIAVSTVRAQIKSIFAKTGVSRQSELVALLRGMPGVSRPPI
jgi:DNA-binding CsgD family transcriptional regulator